MNVGDIVRLVRVRFPGQMLPGIFLADQRSFEHGQKVVAMSDRGMTIGFVNSQVYEAPYSEEMGELFTIKRLASDEDVIKYKEAYQHQRKAREVFNRLVEQHELPMKLQDVEFISQGYKILFHYTAPERVDFRSLLKDLARELKNKIELRQLTDHVQSAKIGPCGPDLCLFINSVVGLKRSCSEAYCCLEDNDHFYKEKRSRLPKNNALIATHTGEIGKVQQVDFVKEEFEILTDQGCVKRYVSELYKETLNKKTTTFPREFDYISHDTKIVIGERERSAKKEREKQIEFNKLSESAKEFAETVWKNLNL